MAQTYMEYQNIPKEKFAFVHEGERITDKKFDDKPIGYFKDAWIRFRKNRASVVAAVIIILIILFAFLTPLLTRRYDVTFMDVNYAKKAPRITWLRPLGIAERRREEKLFRHQSGAGGQCGNRCRGLGRTRRNP